MPKPTPTGKQEYQLLNINTGEEVKLNENSELLIQRGVHTGTWFKVAEVIYPCTRWPEGLIKSPKVGMTWQQLLPSVFDVYIVDLSVDADPVTGEEN